MASAATPEITAPMPRPRSRLRLASLGSKLIVFSTVLTAVAISLAFLALSLQIRRQTRSMLAEALAAGDKALIFTQFAEMGSMLRHYLQETLGCEVIKETDTLTARLDIGAKTMTLQGNFALTSLGPPPCVQNIFFDFGGINMTITGLSISRQEGILDVSGSAENPGPFTRIVPGTGRTYVVEGTAIGDTFTGRVTVTVHDVALVVPSDPFSEVIETVPVTGTLIGEFILTTPP